MVSHHCTNCECLDSKFNLVSWIHFSKSTGFAPVRYFRMSRSSGLSFVRTVPRRSSKSMAAPLPDPAPFGAKARFDGC